MTRQNILPWQPAGFTRENNPPNLLARKVCHFNSRLACLRFCLRLVRRTVSAQDGAVAVRDPGRCCLLSDTNESLIPHSSLREDKLRLTNTEIGLCQVAIKTELLIQRLYPLQLSTVMSCYHFSAAKLNPIITELNSATPG